MTTLTAKIRAAFTRTNAPDHAEASVPDDADPRIVAQLGRIMVLRDSGKMTEEAFWAKRAELLAEIESVRH